MRDPVCGMNVDPNKAAATEKWDGDDYYFCSIHCQEKFLANPKKC